MPKPEMRPAVTPFNRHERRWQHTRSVIEWLSPYDRGRDPFDHDPRPRLPDEGEAVPLNWDPPERENAMMHFRPPGGSVFREKPGSVSSEGIDNVRAYHVPTSSLVDFHCHLDLYPDHAAAVTECERAGIFTLTVTTTPRAWPCNKELAAPTRHVRAALGLHPQLVAERAGELPLWEEYLPEARYVGEVGLDAGPRFYRSLDLQKQVFERVLRACARAGGKILSVHSVRAATAVLDMVEAHLPPSRGRIVLHWFTGGKAEARRAVDLGCYFSINGEMFSNERHSATIAMLPIERILTESDGPFTQVLGRPARPADVHMSVELLARGRGIDPDLAVSTVRANLKRLLSESP